MAGRNAVARLWCTLDWVKAGCLLPKTLKFMVAVGALLAAWLPAAQGTTQTLGAPFTLSVLQDGGIVPFARFDGTRWATAWPSTDDSRKPAPSLDAIPPSWLGGTPTPRDWWVWFADGGTKQLRVVGTHRTFSCEGPVVLEAESRLASASTPNDMAHIGLALDSVVPVESIHLLVPSETEWASASSAVHDFIRNNSPQLLRAELSVVSVEPAVSALLLSELPQQPVLVDWVYRGTAKADEPVYYFEAHAQLTGDSAGGNPGATFVGWSRRRSDGWTTLSAAALWLGNESPPPRAPRRVPVGIINLAGRTYWVMEEYGYEAGDVVLFEAGASRFTEILRGASAGC